MKRLIFATLFLAAACQSAPGTPSGDPAYAQCDVLISFGSVCCGVDQATKTRMTEYVAADRRVTESSERSWGREGESDLCIATRSSSDPVSLSRDLTAMIPTRAEGSSVGTTSVRWRRK